MKKVFILTGILGMTLASAATPAFATTSRAAQCAELFVDLSADLSADARIYVEGVSAPAQALPSIETMSEIQHRNQKRIEQTLALTYPMLMRSNQSPTVIAQFMLRKTTQMMSQISRFNRDGDTLDAGKIPLANQLMEHNENLVHQLELLGEEIDVARRYYQKLWKRGPNLEKKGAGLDKKLTKTEELAKKIGEENILLNEKLVKVNEKLNQLTEEIDFINGLIEKINEDIVLGAFDHTVQTKLETEAIPVLVNMSISLMSLQILVDGALEKINGSIKLNQIALEQMRELVQLGFTGMLENYPQLKKYIKLDEHFSSPEDRAQATKTREEVEEALPLCITGNLCTGQIVSIIEGKGTVKGFLPNGEIHVLLDSGQLYRAYRNQIAITESRAKFKSNKIGDGVMDSHGSIGVIEGIFPDGNFLVRFPENRLGMSHKEFYQLVASAGKLDGFEVHDQVEVRGNSKTLLYYAKIKGINRFTNSIAVTPLDGVRVFFHSPQELAHMTR